MDGGAWWATVHGVAKSRTRQGDFTIAKDILHDSDIQTNMCHRTNCFIVVLPLKYSFSIYLLQIGGKTLKLKNKVLVNYRTNFYVKLYLAQ